VKSTLKQKTEEHKN